MKKNFEFKVLTFLFLLKLVLSGHAPHVPAGHRVQYYLIHPASGRYKYGYDTGSNYFAEQHADSNNQVEGQYAYKDDKTGHNLGLKYTAGVQGFVPAGFDYTNLYHKYQPIHQNTAQSYPSFLTYSPQYQHDQHNLIGPHPDGSYSFSYTAGDHAREESADSAGNVRGRYWYINKDGKQDLSYIAGKSTGFHPTGGSLATPVHLPGRHVDAVHGSPTDQHTFRYYHLSPHYQAPMYNYAPQYISSNDVLEGPNPDGSYRFSYSTDDQAREEHADTSGTVRGSYWYINKDGKYDLSYIAGVATGFQLTGGNLATPVHLPANHVGTSLGVHVPHSSHHPTSEDENDSTTEYPQDDESNTGDASYNFKIETDEYQREESSDSAGNIQGKYSYQNRDGQFDLEYQAGAGTGFVATGGNLASAETVPKTAQSQYSSNLEGVSHGAGSRPDFVTINAHLAPSHGISASVSPGSVVPLQAVKYPSHQHSAMNGIVLKSFVPLVSDRDKYGYIFESKH